MNKKYIFSILLSALFLLSGPVLAISNCDDQAKPAFECPTGYSMMCISAGGDHWGCGKESGGVIFETSANASVSVGGTSSSSRTTTSVSAYGTVGTVFVLDGSRSEDDGTVKTYSWKQVSGPTVNFSSTSSMKTSVTPKVAGTYVFELTVTDANGVSRVDQKITVNVKDSDASTGSTLRVLPTVNKVEEDASTERQTPKRDFGDRMKAGLDTASKVTVRGWDADKKEAIEGKVLPQLENDSAIKSVEITESNVVMIYSTPAKLFGFININMNINISADADGRVKVKFPWYRFLVKTEFAGIKEKFDYIYQNNQSDLEFIKVRGTAEAQTEIFLEISKTMHEMSKSIIQNIRG